MNISDGFHTEVPKEGGAFPPRGHILLLSDTNLGAQHWEHWLRFLSLAMQRAWVTPCSPCTGCNAGG